MPERGTRAVAKFKSIAGKRGSSIAIEVKNVGSGAEK